MLFLMLNIFLIRILDNGDSVMGSEKDKDTKMDIEIKKLLEYGWEVKTISAYLQVPRNRILKLREKHDLTK